MTIKRSRLIFWESRIAKKKKARHQRRQTSNATSKRLYRQNSRQKRKSQALLVLKEKSSRSWCLTNLSCCPRYESYLLTLSKAFANKKRRGKHLSLLRLSNNTKLKKFTRYQHLAAKKKFRKTRETKLLKLLMTLRMMGKFTLMKLKIKKKSQKSNLQ